MSGDESEDDADLLVRGSSDVEETFKGGDLSVAIGVLQGITTGELQRTKVTNK